MRALAYPAIIFFLLLMLCVAALSDQKPNITVLIIDTGIDVHHELLSDRAIVCPKPNDCADFWGHGTHVASLVLNGPLTVNNKPTNKVCDRVVVHSCDYGPQGNGPGDYFACLEYAKWLKPDFINFSSTGTVWKRREYNVFQSLPATTFVVAAGNNGNNLKEHPEYPAIFPRISALRPDLKVSNLSNVITVGALTQEGKHWVTSNSGDFLVWEKGTQIRSATTGNGYEFRSGTSMATAIRTNKLLKQKCDEL